MHRGVGFWSGLGRTLQTRVGRRVFLLFITCAVLPVTVLGVASYQSVSKALRQQAFDRSRLTAKRMGTALFERFVDLRPSLSFAASAWRARHDLVIDPRFVSVAVVSERSSEVLRGTLPALPRLNARQHAHLKAGGTIVAVSPDTSTAILMAQAFDAAGETSGIIWAQVSDELVDRVLVSESTAATSGPSCIVLPDGAIVRCRDGISVGKGSFAPALGSNVSGAFVWDSDERNLAGFFSLFLGGEFAAGDWRFIYSEPESEILAPMRLFRRWFALAGGLALLIVGFLSIGQIRRHLQPLDALQAATDRVARLEFDSPVDVKSGDEFEDLADAFNGMSQRVRDQFVEADRLNQALGNTTDELRERQVRLGAILDTAADAIITVDIDRRIESFNRTAERVFGLSEAEAIGSSLDALIVSQGLTSDATGRRADGTMFAAEVVFTEARAGERMICTVFVRDVSERKRAAEERDQLESHLRHAQKMETIGTLAGGIAHDFNNILTPIMGYVDLALGEDSSDNIKEDLGEVRRAAMRAKDLVQQILLFSRRGEREFSTFELGPVVQEALKLLRSSLPTTIEIRSVIACDVPRVTGDATQLHQVLMNLCTNAYHAMRDHGGVLDVRLDMTEREGKRAVRLRVADSGHGMDAATLQRLFEPFFTTKAAGEGTGLGMSIVHGIIAQHGGTVTVDSIIGTGTSFEIVLPAAAQDAGISMQAAAVTQERGQGRVLVVDDEAVIGRLVVRMLERQGYSAVATTKPRDVLEMLATGSPSFDLVITDQTMPGMTGLQLAEKIQTWRPEFPVVLLSGYSELGGAQNPRELGLCAVLTKPVSAEVLTATVARALSEERPLVQAIAA